MSPFSAGCVGVEVLNNKVMAWEVGIEATLPEFSVVCLSIKVGWVYTYEQILDRIDR